MADINTISASGELAKAEKLLSAYKKGESWGRNKLGGPSKLSDFSRVISDVTDCLPVKPTRRASRHASQPASRSLSNVFCIFVPHFFNYS
jgi:hypothetical protein